MLLTDDFLLIALMVRSDALMMRLDAQMMRLDAQMMRSDALMMRSDAQLDCEFSCFTANKLKKSINWINAVLFRSGRMFTPADTRSVC